MPTSPFTQGLKVIPVINKIDLPSANLGFRMRQLEDILTIPAEEAILASGKSGIGIEDILEAVVSRVPPPRWTDYPHNALLVFDSKYDAYRGVISHVRVFSGRFKAGEMMMLMSSGQKSEIKEVGMFPPGHDWAPGSSDRAMSVTSSATSRASTKSRSATPSPMRINPRPRCFPVTRKCDRWSIADFIHWSQTTTKN